MKALLITPDSEAIEAIEITGREDIVKLIGYETLEMDSVGEEGDRLYFDEECFLRGSKGRFQIDKIIPVSGKGVIVGTAEDGESLRDVATDIADLRARIKFL